jgi:hypothetical protein
VRDRFLNLNKSRAFPDSELVFVEDLAERYEHASEPGNNTTASPDTFKGKTEMQCWELLKDHREATGSHITINEFVILDERSLEDGTVLLVEGPVDYRKREMTKSVRAEFSLAQLHAMSWASIDGNVTEDLASVQSHATDGVLRDWGKEQRRRMEAIPPREPPTAINTDNEDPQPASLLFSLPSELRLKIYEYVFGSGAIHIRTRRCKPTARPSPRFGFYSTYTYVVCPIRNSWEQSYALSKQSSPPDWMSKRENYRMTHSECMRPLREFSAQEYVEEAEGCRIYRGWRADSQAHFEECQACQQYRKEQNETFGPAATGGLEKRHANSGVHLNILLVCRATYREAFEIPYANYCFDFEISDLEHWARKILYPHQARAIKSAHFNAPSTGPFVERPEVLEKVFEVLPGLKQLRLSVPVIADQKAWDAISPPRELESAEVITIHGNDRMECRKRAGRIEGLLTGETK